VARVAASIVTLILLMTVSAPVGADDSGSARVTGYVRSENGLPAYGVCVTTGEYAVDVRPDGTYELDLIPSYAHRMYFYNCHDADGYPYISRWFWGGGQDWDTAERFTVGPGETFHANITLPFVSGSPPEFGAVAGVIRSETPDSESMFLINDAGDVYSAWSDRLTPLPGHETATYIVAAPPGEYRLLTMGSDLDKHDGYLPVYYGTHPRGFAVTYGEAETIVISSGGYTAIDFDLVAGESRYDSSSSSSNSLGISPEQHRPGVRMIVPEGRVLDRVAVYQAGTALNEILLLAIPDVRSTGPAQVTLMIPVDVLGVYEPDTIPVWLDHGGIQDCQTSLDDDCIVGRELDPYNYPMGEVVEIEVRTTTGGVFRVGDRPQFYDAEDSVFGGDILWLADSEVTKGCNASGDLFCPDDAVTRGQMAAFLVRGLGLTDSLDDPFTDDESSIFEADIEKLAAAGVTRGCNPPLNDRFCPDESVTRGQMAAFLVRALGYTAGVGSDQFSDDDGSIFEADVERLAEAGVTKGCNPPTNDRFCPDAPVTRAQMAAFLHRAIGD